MTSAGVDSRYMGLMKAAAAHAGAHGAPVPVLSPLDSTVLSGAVPVEALQASGIRIIPWTTDDPDKMRAVIRTGVDGLISDRPDLLVQVVNEERASSPEAAARLRNFDIEGHRGARGLRPENTLPAFEAGMDAGINTIETDTGVTTDHRSLIWHDQFLNPQSCRRADGKPYTMENRVYTRDISMPEAQATFICDKLHFGPDQRNDLSLSPVAVAFAEHEHLQSPYVPTYAAQLFRFAAFYAAYYRSGAGRNDPHAAAHAHTGEHVRFNLETKIIPDNLTPDDIGENVPAAMLKNHTVGPEIFAEVLCGGVIAAGVVERADIQSFDFRTLQIVEAKYPKILTVYLTGAPQTLSGALLPEGLRQPAP
jgi:glycerophosphoryl diester phosphodiesterase